MCERQIRGDNDFAKFFEDFVYRVRANWPPEKHYGLALHRLPDTAEDKERRLERPKQDGPHRLHGPLEKLGPDRPAIPPAADEAEPG